ncbi:MAG: ABC transporter ATP-binding protein [Lachnospiraceae bacterium]|nr:ABC transporter ATP-binding protein [Lachnospiraceae bacterium]
MTILKTEKLTKIYGKKDTAVTAVDHIDLEVKKGSFVAIVGSSGSGKSTFLHLIGGVDTPTEGEVFIEDENIYKLSDIKRSSLRRRKIGFVFQTYNLIPVLTVEENIKMPLLLDGCKVNQEKIDSIMEDLQLTKRKNHLPNQLSGGQQQRVAIGRALANNPSIIIADEPTGNLDKKNSEEVMELLTKAVRKGGQTLILVTHEPDIAAMADRIIHLEDGKIISDTENKNVSNPQ